MSPIRWNGEASFAGGGKSQYAGTSVTDVSCRMRLPFSMAKSTAATWLQASHSPAIHVQWADIPYSRCQSLKPSLVFLNRASYGRRRNNDVTSQEREVTMMLHHNLRTDAQICGKSATQASLFVRHGRGVNRVYWTGPLLSMISQGSNGFSLILIEWVT